MNTIETIRQIEHDFVEQEPPFDDVVFPEARLLNTLTLNTLEERLQAVSLFATLDYNRDANQMVNKILELRDSHLFDPEFVASNEEYVREAFDDVAFRYRNRDADAWIKNCRIIADEYGGRWTELVLSTECDAPRLVQQLEDDDFNVLKGVKVAPMYARIINDDVVPLSNLWELAIPVDTHIRRLSTELIKRRVHETGSRLQRSVTDDDIRTFWRDVAEAQDISPAVVDGALWHIGNNWERWGKEYWESLP